MKINELRYLFELYTVEAPSLDVLIGPRGDKLVRSGNSIRYQTFPTGRASPRYVVSVMQEPETYKAHLTLGERETVLPEIIEDATDSSYTIAQCREFLRKIEHDDNALQCDRTMYRMIQKDPTLKNLLPGEVLFWSLLELSEGRKVYETGFEAPQECIEAARRYALHSARILCDSQPGLVYDESTDVIGILKKEEKRRLVCISASGTVAAEQDRWEWTSCKR